MTRRTVAVGALVLVLGGGAALASGLGGASEPIRGSAEPAGHTSPSESHDSPPDRSGDVARQTASGSPQVDSAPDARAPEDAVADPVEVTRQETGPSDLPVETGDEVAAVPPELQEDPVNTPADPPEDMSSVPLDANPVEVISNCGGVKGKLVQYRAVVAEGDAESLRGLLDASGRFQDGISSFSGSVEDLEAVEMGLSTVRREWSTALSALESGAQLEGQEHVASANEELDRLIEQLPCEAPGGGE